MSGYWDALGRAALGLPGAAMPRPRTLFELDHRPVNTLAAMEEEAAPDPPAISNSGATSHVATEEARHSVVHESRDRTEEEAPPYAKAWPGEELDDKVFTFAPPHEPREAAAYPLAPASSAIHVERVETLRVERLERIDAAPAPAITPPVSSLSAIATPPPRAEPSEPAVAAAGEKPVATHNVTRPIEVTAQVRADTPAPPAAAAAAAPPPLVIEIERIEIRLDHDRAAPIDAPRRAAVSAVPSLDDYLARRGQGSR